MVTSLPRPQDPRSGPVDGLAQETRFGAVDRRRGRRLPARVEWTQALAGYRRSTPARPSARLRRQTGMPPRFLGSGPRRRGGCGPREEAHERGPSSLVARRSARGRLERTATAPSRHFNNVASSLNAVDAKVTWWSKWTSSRIGVGYRRLGF